MNIHSTAIVDPGARLADDVEVQAYSIIGPQVSLGAGTVVGPHCVIEGRTEIGERNRFFSGAQIGVLSQDLKHRAGLVGRLTMGDDNVVREHASISASTHSSEADDHRLTSIGSNCLVMTSAHVGHDSHIGSHVIIANYVAIAGHVEVEDRAIIGGLVAVHQFCRIGTLAMIGGTTRVWNDAPPFMITDGNPARCAGPNKVGLQRNGFDDGARKRIKLMYKIVWRSHLNTSQALERIENEIEDSHDKRYFIEFVRNSTRGITR
ncbi:MAG: acyl-ACP--UDP-N-acetylglucosamine O-acyltransferase [Candidatus Hydrogenedentes bacterium]|nr:acyl-ACP--UDP-N-acetylglucosamine O-acyltransferase [Candidatus Hydrogenedentota bacterium]